MYVTNILFLPLLQKLSSNLLQSYFFPSKGQEWHLRTSPFTRAAGHLVAWDDKFTQAHPFIHIANYPWFLLTPHFINHIEKFIPQPLCSRHLSPAALPTDSCIFILYYILLVLKIYPSIFLKKKKKKRVQVSSGHLTGFLWKGIWICVSRTPILSHSLLKPLISAPTDYVIWNSNSHISFFICYYTWK